MQRDRKRINRPNFRAVHARQIDGRWHLATEAEPDPVAGTRPYLLLSRPYHTKRAALARRRRRRSLHHNAHAQTATGGT